MVSLSEEPKEKQDGRDKGEIWWSNGTFFIALHLFGLYGAIFLAHPSELPVPTIVLCIVSWQLATFGITIGYHRLWSHQAFTARMPLRIALAWMGSLGFQGSIRWWVLRHRLHHRFTDSLTHDPYSAAKGIWYSHCGWIFRKPAYPRMRFIDRADLVADPVVCFQHKYYIVIALSSGLVLPAAIGYTWGDALGGLIWGGVIARLLIWHSTFCINSLAHWAGLRPYTEEVSARGNYLLAILTAGEGNHNFHHAFPKDFRNGPHPADWDPSKWIIYLLHRYTTLVPTIARTPTSTILKAQATVLRAEADRLTSSLPLDQRTASIANLPVWTPAEALAKHGEWLVDRVGEEAWRKRRCVIRLIEGGFINVGGYLDEHPGGQQLLLNNCIAPLAAGLALAASVDPDASAHPHIANPRSAKMPDADVPKLRDASHSFFGGMNNHSAAAKDRMRCLRVATLKEEQT